MNLNEVTVTIPLYNGADYSEIVFTNIDRLVDHCRLIVSDSTKNDNLLEKVSLKFGSKPNLKIIGKRNLETGWVPHWNDLLSRIETKYFMWLPQDDEIELDWVSENLKNLKNDRSLAGSFGILLGNLNNDLIEYGGRMPSISKGSRKYLANSLIETWPAIGVATRSIWDKSKVLPILHTQPPNDEWADIIWMYGTLLQHPIGQIYNTAYRKRWYSGSASSTWRPFDMVYARNLLLREINRRHLSLEPGVELLEICLANKIKEFNDLSNNWNNIMHEKDQHLNKVLTSKSWRLTRPIRAVMKSLRNI